MFITDYEYIWGNYSILEYHYSCSKWSKMALHMTSFQIQVYYASRSASCYDLTTMTPKISRTPNRSSFSHYAWIPPLDELSTAKNIRMGFDFSVS